MTIEELNTLAENILQLGVKLIRLKGGIDVLMHLIRSDGGIEIIASPGPLANSPRAKKVISDLVKDRVKASGIEAVLTLSDVYFGFLSQENFEYRKRMKWSVRECQEHGLMEKKEAVVVLLESPILCRMIRQEYQRDGETIRLIGEPIVLSDGSDGYTSLAGNFVGFFEHPTAKAAN